MAPDSEHKAVQGPGADGAANLGLIRPPAVYLGSIGAGLLIHWFRPVRLFPSSIHMPVGILMILAAVVLFVSAVRAFRKAGTPIPGNRPTTAIVHTGPYRASRNPIYLAFTLFQAGLAAAINSLGVLVAVFPALALMALVVVPREERYLEARFPSDYLSYKRKVRRWL